MVLLAALSLLSSAGEPHGLTTTGLDAHSAETVAGSPRQDRVLAVSYVSQGPTRWCFQASLAMVLRYYDKPVELADMARSSKKGPGDSMSLLDLSLGWLESYVGQWPGLSVRQDAFRVWEFEDYRSRIEGRVPAPVVVSSFGLPGHTVVVVGYSVENGQRYLSVHDPSGYLTESRWGTSRASFARVDWARFSGFSQSLLVRNIVVELQTATRPSQ